MPPGRALVEVLFGRSGLRLGRQKAPPGRPGQKAGRTEAQQHALHTSRSHPSASNATRAVAEAPAGGRLINRLVELFSPLLHAPGVTKTGGAKAAIEPHLTGTGRRLLLNKAAGLHTAARPRGVGGFGTVRPNALPRSTNQLGLNSARNFSSSRTVFENVVQNAPLGLRVLGDKDRLDMRSIRRDMRQAYAKKRKQDAQMGKGKGKALFVENDFMGYRNTPAGIDEYFPVDEKMLAATQPSVQLVLPLNPIKEEASFLSMNEDAEESRFFSALLMSDLRLLHDMYGRHNARIRNVIAKLESAGCFDPDMDTGLSSVKAVLDEANARLIVTFYGKRWTMADVRQVLGHYQARSSWYELVDVQASSTYPDMDDDLLSLPSSLPSVAGDGLASFPLTRAVSFENLRDYSDCGEEAASLHMPSYETVSAASAEVHSLTSLHPRSDSYLSGVEDFLSSLENSRRPNFGD